MDEILERLKSNKNQDKNKYSGSLSQYGTVFKGMETHRNGETIQERLEKMNIRRALREELVRKIMNDKNIKYREASNIIKSQKLKF
jgi:hypothetical protein